MLRNLLRNRFKLAFHFNAKETTVYELAVGPNGSKLKESAARAECQSDHPVESPDKDGYPTTGLNGKYDIDLKWVNDDAMLSERSKAIIKSELGEIPEMGPGPPLIRAVPDQLGLKLNSKKGSTEIVAIDHIEKVPTAN